jgi:predicted membrane protein
MFMRQGSFGDGVKIVFVFSAIFVYVATWSADIHSWVFLALSCFFYVYAAVEVRGFCRQDRLCFFPAIFVYAATETCWLALFSCTTIVLFLVLEAALASSSS